MYLLLFEKIIHSVNLNSGYGHLRHKTQSIDREIFLPRENPQYSSDQRKCFSEETGNHHSEVLLLSSSLQVSVSCPSPCSPLATLRSLIGQCHNVTMQGPVFTHRISILYLTDCASIANTCHPSRVHFHAGIINLKVFKKVKIFIE